MKQMKGKQIDEFFRKGLSEPDIPFQEEHWDVLREELEKRKNRKRVVIWWKRAGGIAAMLVMGLLVWNYQKPDTTSVKKNNAGSVVENTAGEQHAEGSAEDVQALPFPVQPEAPAAHAAEKMNPAERGNSSGRRLAAENRVKTPAVNTMAVQEIPQARPVQAAPDYQAMEIDGVRMAGISPGSSFRTSGEIGFPEKPRVTLSAAPDERSVRPLNDEPAFQPSLTFSILAAPDLNGVNDFTESRVGLNGGVGVTLGVLSRLSFSTGIAYAKKVYKTDFSHYKPYTNYKFPVTPNAVNADCRVLDIPFNVNYTVWDKIDRSIQLTGGVSSYVMLHEKYTFSYQNPNAKAPKSYEVRKQNRHYAGILNLAADYQQQIGKKVSLGVQPYVKLPIDEIGYGNVKLESAGVSLNVNYSLKIKRP